MTDLPRDSQEGVIFPAAGPILFAPSISPGSSGTGPEWKLEDYRGAGTPQLSLAPGGRRRLLHKGKSLLAQEGPKSWEPGAPKTE